MSPVSTDGINSYRYERKFIVPPLLDHSIEEVICNSSAGFRICYPDRVVNNIYLDTPMYRFYNENVMGVPDRKKIRIRWYGGKFTEGCCRLEIKRKSGLVGTKDVYESFLKLTDLCKSNVVNKFQLPDSVKMETADVHPTLHNIYLRRYFLSADSRFRVTIDRNVKYFQPQIFAYGQNSFGEAELCSILELKYDRKYDLLASKIADIVPLDLSKKSKYISGMERLCLL